MVWVTTGYIDPLPATSKTINLDLSTEATIVNPWIRYVPEGTQPVAYNMYCNNKKGSNFCMYRYRYSSNYSTILTSQTLSFSPNTTFNYTSTTTEVFALPWITRSAFENAGTTNRYDQVYFYDCVFNTGTGATVVPEYGEGCAIVKDINSSGTNKNIQSIQLENYYGDVNGYYDTDTSIHTSSYNPDIPYFNKELLIGNEEITFKDENEPKKTTLSYNPTTKELATGSWKEVARYTVKSSGALSPQFADRGFMEVDVPKKKFYMVLLHIKGKEKDFIANGDFDTEMIFNNDPSTRYYNRYTTNHGAYATSNDGGIKIITKSVANADSEFAVIHIYNPDTPEGHHLVMSQAVREAGSGVATAPDGHIGGGNWKAPGEYIEKISVRVVPINSDYSFAVGSEMVVLGYDPSDVHSSSDNFWQKLGEGTASGSSLSVSFTPKKYLMIRTATRNTNNINTTTTFNNDTNSNYTFSQWTNNAFTDSLTQSNILNALDYAAVGNQHAAGIGFMVNSDDKPKLMISQVPSFDNSNSQRQRDTYSKWDTSTQASSIQITAPGSYVGGKITVWGHD